MNLMSSAMVVNPTKFKSTTKQVVLSGGGELHHQQRQHHHHTPCFGLKELWSCKTGITGHCHTCLVDLPPSFMQPTEKVANRVCIFLGGEEGKLFGFTPSAQADDVVKDQDFRLFEQFDNGPIVGLYWGCIGPSSHDSYLGVLLPHTFLVYSLMGGDHQSLSLNLLSSTHLPLEATALVPRPSNHPPHPSRMDGRESVFIHTSDSVMYILDQNDIQQSMAIPESTTGRTLLLRDPSQNLLIMGSAGDKRVYALLEYQASSENAADLTTGVRWAEKWALELHDGLIDIQGVHDILYLLTDSYLIMVNITTGEPLRDLQLQYNPACFYVHAYAKPSSETRALSVSIMVCPHDDNMLIYSEEGDLLWRCRTSGYMINLQTFVCEGLSGVILSLDRFGVMRASYLGKDQVQTKESRHSVADQGEDMDKVHELPSVRSSMPQERRKTLVPVPEAPKARSLERRSVVDLLPKAVASTLSETSHHVIKVTHVFGKKSSNSILSTLNLQNSSSKDLLEVRVFLTLKSSSDRIVRITPNYFALDHTFVVGHSQSIPLNTTLDPSHANYCNHIDLTIVFRTAEQSPEDFPITESQEITIPLKYFASFSSEDINNRSNRIAEKTAHARMHWVLPVSIELLYPEAGYNPSRVRVAFHGDSAAIAYIKLETGGSNHDSVFTIESTEKCLLWPVLRDLMARLGGDSSKHVSEISSSYSRSDFIEDILAHSKLQRTVYMAFRIVDSWFLQVEQVVNVLEKRTYSDRKVVESLKYLYDDMMIKLKAWIKKYVSANETAQANAYRLQSMRSLFLTCDFKQFALPPAAKKVLSSLISPIRLPSNVNVDPSSSCVTWEDEVCVGLSSYLKLPVDLTPSAGSIAEGLSSLESKLVLGVTN